MKGQVLGVRLGLRAVIPAELITLGLATVLLAFTVAPLYALIAAVAVAVCVCLVTFIGLAPWQWAGLAVGWLRHREHKIALLEDATDIEVDGTTVGMHIDGHTVITMISVWGKPYMPTLLHPQKAETPNTLPLTVIAEQMHRVGLGVDVDVICEGRRTAADNYAALYATFLRGRSAAGRRTTTLVVRMDTRAADTVTGLLWRRNTAEAAAAATRRITRALQQVNCRAQILSAAQMREAAVAGVGGPDALAETFRDQWTRLHRSGHGYVTSYYFSAEDLRSATLDDVWSYQAEHTTLVVALRRDGSTVRASAMVRLSTPQPLATAPALVLNRYTGRQWAAVADTLPGRARLTGLPSTPVTSELDSAVVVGPSGVMIGRSATGCR